MTSWTSFIRGWEAPGRPYKWQPAAVASVRRPPAREQLSLKLDNSTVYRTLLRICLLILAISSSVRSAPLPLPAHQQQLQEEGKCLFMSMVVAYKPYYPACTWTTASPTTSCRIYVNMQSINLNCVLNGTHVSTDSVSRSIVTALVSFIITNAIM